MKKINLVFALITMFFMTANAQENYILVTEASQLEAGYNYLIVGYHSDKVCSMAKRKTGNSYPAITISTTSALANAMLITPATNFADAASPYEFLIDGTVGAWTIYSKLDALNGSNGGYLKPRGNGSNGLQNTTEQITWNISIAAGGLTTIQATDNTTFDRGRLRYNYSDNIFSCYNNSSPYASSTDVYLYKRTDEPTLIVPQIDDVASGEDVIITYFIANDPGGYKVNYSLENQAPVEIASDLCVDMITLTGLADGLYTIILDLVDDNCDLVNSHVERNFRVGEEITPIYDIQYTTAANGDSPKKDKIVTIEGIVTMVITHVGGTNAGKQDGYYVQDAKAPWSGIYVVDVSNNPTVGSTIALKGTVKESYNLTRLESITKFETVSLLSKNWEPMLVDCETAATEDYEGCYVMIKGIEIVNVEESKYGNYGISDIDTIQIMQLNKTHQIQSSKIKLGDTYCARGVIDYSYSKWRILPDYLSDDCTNGLILNDFSNINIFPNPATNQITIQTENTLDNVTIINAIGQIVMSIDNVENGQIIEISSLKNGLYLINLKSEDKIKLEKLIIEGF